jgi:hypothetical protein
MKTSMKSRGRKREGVEPSGERNARQAGFEVRQERADAAKLAGLRRMIAEMLKDLIESRIILRRFDAPIMALPMVEKLPDDVPIFCNPQ